MTDHDLERRLWETMREASSEEAGRKVRIGRLADLHLPVPHKQWTVEKVKRWDNEGLVIAYQNGAVAALTEEGVRTEVPDWLDDD